MFLMCSGKKYTFHKLIVLKIRNLTIPTTRHDVSVTCI